MPPIQQGQIDYSLYFTPKRKEDIQERTKYEKIKSGKER